MPNPTQRQSVPVGPHSQDAAMTALRRSVPRTADAIQLFERLERALGERAVRDDWVFSAERALLLRDAERPDWFFPQRRLYLHLEATEPEPPTFADPAHAALFASLPPLYDDEEVVSLSRPTPPAILRIQEGQAYLQVRYDRRGRWAGSEITAGDLAAFGKPDEPLALDPGARPPQVPPISWFARSDLDPAGHSIDDLVSWLAADPPEQGRVHVPVPIPGGVQGTFVRGLWQLRAAAWEGRIADDGGWVVIDGLNGTAVATGPTFDEAVAAWRALVARVQPLPPVEDQVEIPDDLPPPSEPTVEEITGEDGSKRGLVSFGTFHLVSVPPLQRPWPEPRPENVPAVALPIPPAPAIPPALAAAGFRRVSRVFGDDGGCGFVFVREDPDGYTFVGDDALPAVDVDRLDAQLDALEAQRMAEYAEMPFYREDPPWERAEYPVHVRGYPAWDPTGRVPGLRVGHASWSAELAPTGWTSALRHEVWRIRRRR